MPQEYGLGRVYEPDSRDEQYHFGLVLPSSYPPLLRRKQWTPPYPMDQGHTGRCVGYSFAGFLACTPLKTLGDPIAIYDQATTLDDDPDNDHDVMSGTSIRAGAKALQQRGNIKSYLWARDSFDVANWILRHGPVVTGLTWYESMFDVSATNGYLQARGRIVGGHATFFYGVDVVTRTFWGQSSWGPFALHEGRFKMTFDTFDNLLQDHGEACVTREIKVTLT